MLIDWKHIAAMEAEVFIPLNLLLTAFSRLTAPIQITCSSEMTHCLVCKCSFSVSCPGEFVVSKFFTEF